MEKNGKIGLAHLRPFLRDVVYFALMCRVEPFPYQVDFLRCDSKRICWVAGRQVGKTLMSAVKSLHFALVNNNSLVLVVSPTFRQSQILFDKIRGLLLSVSVLSSCIDHITRTQVTLTNGSKIISLPSGLSGETIRGYSADMVIVDEAAYVQDEVFLAIEPAIAVTDGTLILIGTPAGKTGRFWNAFNSESFARFHSRTADNIFVSPSFLEEKKMELTDAEYRQEFLGEFVEEVDSFFSSAMVKGQMVLEETQSKEDGYDYFLGVDVARYGTDETAYVITRTRDYVEWEMVSYITTEKKPLTDVAGRVIELNKKWAFRWIAVDETGLGGGVVDMLKEQGLNVSGVTYTQTSKAELYSRLKWLLENKKLKLLNSGKLYNQMMSLRCEYSSIGGIKIIKDARGHEDIVDALALALPKRTEKIEILEFGDV